MFKLVNNENRHIVQSIAIYNLGGIFTKAKSVEVNIYMAPQVEYISLLY